VSANITQPDNMTVKFIMTAYQNNPSS